MTKDQNPEQMPETIYLQWYGVENPHPDDGPQDLSDVCWCADKVFNSDISYTRTKTFNETVNQLRSERDALKKQVESLQALIQTNEGEDNSFANDSISTGIQP